MADEFENKEVNVYKVMAIVLSVVAVVLIGLLFYITSNKTTQIEGLTGEKEALTQELIELQSDYSVLSTSNDTLNEELNREREKVEQLLERIKKTDANNRAKLRQYEKELGTLRSVMRHYVVQIDSLNVLNTELRAEAVKAREEARRSKKQYDDAAKTANEYAKRVEQGSVLKGRAIEVCALNSKDKLTDRSSRATKLQVSVTLLENAIAKKGYRNVYLRVKDPDGILMAESQDQVFKVGGKPMIYSAAREVDYQGGELDVTVYYEAPEFFKGVYNIEVYTTDGILGSADLLLK